MLMQYINSEFFSFFPHMYFAVPFILFHNMLSFLCREYRNCHFLTEFSMILSSLDLDKSYSTFMKIYVLSAGIHRGWPYNEWSWKTHEEETIYSGFFLLLLLLAFFFLFILKKSCFSLIPFLFILTDFSILWIVEWKVTLPEAIKSWV